MAFNIKLKDFDGHVVAYFDPAEQTDTYTYSATAAELQQFTIKSLNQYTGANSELQLTLALE